ncbi:MAG TPA: hypothetical protein VFA96_09660 [Nocardioides sp.]|nr:hypothetical protein [Nocardioides sp.]
MLRKLTVAVVLTALMGIGGLASPASADALNRCLRRADRAFNHNFNTRGGDVARALLRDARTRCHDRALG